ncbi:putative oxidoreductase glyr1 [Tyrophagus putrescentiae]|nr:putative oxidoreductase glyr1 [Tyrophagus putrescentiae]
MSTPKTPNSKPCSFDVGHMVWAKVKGYPYWPGLIAETPTEADNAYGKRPKNGVLVFFPDSNSSGWATPDNVKDYIEYRSTYVSAKSTAKYKKAVAQADEKLANKNGPSFELPSTPKTPSVKAEPSTPQTDKAVFKAKKAPAASTPTSVQRDYSRTPFKKEKRSFESTLSSAEVSSSEPRRKSASSDVAENKRVKVESPAQSAKKRANSSPSKSGGEVKSEDDELNDSSLRVIEDKREKAKARTSKQTAKCPEVKYGFIGLGTIGQQVLKHMMTFGNPCTIWNRTPSKCKEFERMGAIVVKTPGDVVRESDITFCCLSDADASSKIFYGNCGVVNEINSSKAYVELTSLDRGTSLDIEHGIKQNGGRYLEAPLICTSSKSVEEGKCTSVIAGDKSLFDECAPAFEKLCSHVFYVGETIGQASQMNVIIATLNGNILGSLLESVSIAERMGIDPKDIVDIIASSPVTNSIIQNKAAALRDSTLLREIPIDHIRRDLTYALQIANLDGYSTPITAATNEMFKQKKHLYY